MKRLACLLLLTASTLLHAQQWQYGKVTDVWPLISQQGNLIQLNASICVGQLTSTGSLSIPVVNAQGYNWGTYIGQWLHGPFAVPYIMPDGTFTTVITGDLSGVFSQGPHVQKVQLRTKQGLHAQKLLGQKNRFLFNVPAFFSDMQPDATDTSVYALGCGNVDIIFQAN